MLNVVASLTKANKAVKGKSWRVESIDFPWGTSVLLSIGFVVPYAESSAVASGGEGRDALRWRTSSEDCNAF